MLKKEIFNFNHQIMLHLQVKIVEDVVEMEYVTQQLDHAHAILDGKEQLVINK